MSGVDRQREIDLVDAGVSVDDILDERVARADQEYKTALAELREAMSDDEALEDYGLDLRRW